ncbi:MAG: Gfo/Idh/MocA family oxidoreductase [Firmicutes bacterium]|nr:Gfo/Idh/MocA family oxidoreductase [Candidatus Colimorpha enterica]
MLNAAIIGYGGIARVHESSYRELEKAGKVKLVAVYARNEKSFTEKKDININEDDKTVVSDFHKYTDLDEMLANEKIDIIDICLPTPLHKSVGIDMLRRGYHVMCEKPMATTYEDCLEMLDEAKKAGKRLMIGQCLHFFPEYEYLKDVVSDGRYGKVKSAFFQRLSSPPLWSSENWIMKKENFGSCLHDLHIHDVDMCLYLFGTPDKIFCKSKDGFSAIDGVTTMFMYEEFAATVMADWSLMNYPFTSEYRVCFEKATVTDLNGKVTVYPIEGEPFGVDLSAESGYTSEIAHFSDVAQGEKDHGKNHVRGAAETIRIINLLAESAEKGGRVIRVEKE